MNPRSLLVLSILVNVVLALVLVIRKPSPGASAPAPSVPSGSQPAPARQFPRQQAEPEQSASDHPTLVDWRMVESEDYKKYVANLRAIGCPEETIRDIIKADVNKLFESRKAALRAGKKKFEFWKTGNPMSGMMMDEDSLGKVQALAKEKRELLKTILGTDVSDTSDFMANLNPFETILDFLPSEKQNQILDIEQRMAAKMSKAFGGGPMDKQDIEDMKRVNAEKDAELSRLLTPQEKEDYDLRMSQTSMMMRMQLDGFNPSEAEFREIFKLRKKFDEEFSMFGLDAGNPDAMKERQESESKMQESIKSLLGETRFAEYQREQDYDFKGVVKVTERQGLPREAAVKVYDMKSATEQEAGRIRGDASLSEDRRQAALGALRANVERSVIETLGQAGYESYKDQPTAHWLRGLQGQSSEVPGVVQDNQVIIRVP